MIDLSPSNFGLSKVLWRQLLKHRNKTFDYCASDIMFRKMPWYRGYMDLHPIQDFKYKFNSWGARADYDYEDLKDAKVILAAGDSFTMNVGGPIEHSWPSLLQEKVNLPVINVAIDGLGPDVQYQLVNKMRKYFDVQHTFVLFNLHGSALADRLADANSTEQKILVLKQYEWPFGCDYAFVPPWVWDEDMRKILLGYFPEAFGYMKEYNNFKYSDIPQSIFTYLLKEDYMLYSNSKWPSLDAMYQQLAIHNHMDNMLSDVDRYFWLKAMVPKCKSYFYRNRDYRHNSKMTNQMIADYFYDKLDPKFKKFNII